MLILFIFNVAFSLFVIASPVSILNTIPPGLLLSSFKFNTPELIIGFVVVNLYPDKFIVIFFPVGTSVFPFICPLSINVTVPSVSIESIAFWRELNSIFPTFTKLFIFDRVL